MKRIVPLLLSLFMTVGCILAVGPAALAEDASPAPTASPAPSEDAPAPQIPAPFAYYRFYDQPHWRELISGVMFEADLDQNGEAEPISFLRDEEADTTAITWGESTLVLSEGSDFVEAAVLDLDAASPFLNLLVIIDYGSDSYVTVALHPENGQLVRGGFVEGSWEWEDGVLWFFQRTDFLGTAFGKRAFRGDDLVPESEWLIMTYIPTEEELENEREDMIEGGTLLHTIRPVPCTVDGQPGLIPADTCVYRTRFRYDDDLTEVCLPDGTLALIACTTGEHGWPCLIEGVDQLDCFDNLFFAD